MTTKEALTEARGLIEKGWTNRFLAVNRWGKHVNPTDILAVKWSARGAIQSSIGRKIDKFNKAWFIQYEIECFLNAIVSTAIGKSLQQYEDDPETTQSNILKIFDFAIERCDNDD